MCICVFVQSCERRGPALSITKDAGTTHGLQTLCERGKRREKDRGQDETEQYVSPSLLSQLPLTFGRKGPFTARAAWSKREFVQSNFILTSLAFVSSKHRPPPPPPPPTSSATACAPIHRPMRSTLAQYEHNEPRGAKGHRSNGDKGH